MSVGGGAGQDESVTASDTFLMSSDMNTAWINVEVLMGGGTGVFDVSWTSLDDVDSTLIMEGSDDESNFGEFGGDLGGVIITSIDNDCQLFTFRVFPTKFIRLAFTSNSATAGTIVWNFEGQK